MSALRDFFSTLIAVFSAVLCAALVIVPMALPIISADAPIPPVFVTVDTHDDDTPSYQTGETVVTQWNPTTWDQAWNIQQHRPDGNCSALDSVVLNAALGTMGSWKQTYDALTATCTSVNGQIKVELASLPGTPDAVDSYFADDSSNNKLFFDSHAANPQLDTTDAPARANRASLLTQNWDALGTNEYTLAYEAVPEGIDYALQLTVNTPDWTQLTNDQIYHLGDLAILGFPLR